MNEREPLVHTILVTGGAGFLGQACARRFRAAGWRVVGLGHGAWSEAQSRAAGYDRWINSSIDSAGLQRLDEQIAAVAHCASNGSVPYSLQNPLEAYERTVGSTAALLEHLRLNHPRALVLYPSSAAVYGATDDRPLIETDDPNPVSPYGFHKLMTEQLLRAHAACFGQPAVAVRFFSIYGSGLRKQLLWEASARLLSGDSPLIFWGTGDETRDWIHVDDAAALMLHLAEQATSSAEPIRVINGASGQRVTVRELLDCLRDALGQSPEMRFNGTIRPGDPRFYHADITRLKETGWRPAVSLKAGMAAYASWARSTLTLPAP